MLCCVVAIPAEKQGVKQATPVRLSSAAEDGVDSNDDETCWVLLKKCEEEAEKIRICLVRGCLSPQTALRFLFPRKTWCVREREIDIS